jgi:hypothetical protein
MTVQVTVGLVLRVENSNLNVKMFYRTGPSQINWFSHRRYDTQQNDTRHNGTYHTRFNCDTQHERHQALCYAVFYCYTECRILYCRPECFKTKRRYTECRHVLCRGAQIRLPLKNVQKS